MKKKHKHIVFLAFLCMMVALSLLLAGCGEKSDGNSGENTGISDENTDNTATTLTGTIIIFQTSPSFGAYDEMCTREIVLDVDQNTITVHHFRIYDDDGNEYESGEEPVVFDESANIHDTDLAKDIYTIISNDKYNKLDDDITTDIMDGDYSYIIVVKDNEIVSNKGGLGAANDGPKVFTEVCDKMKDLGKAAGMW